MVQKTDSKSIFFNYWIGKAGKIDIISVESTNNKLLEIKSGNTAKNVESLDSSAGIIDKN